MITTNWIKFFDMDKFYSCKIKINKEQNLKRLDQALAKLSNYTRSQIKILLIIILILIVRFVLVGKMTMSVL